ncbi:MAG: Ig-like domain-containing protein [Oscillospiraceae bacterium]|nr:Ig-like domain-containing protein [Oscillospiraceae bacterium]
MPNKLRTALCIMLSAALLCPALPAGASAAVNGSPEALQSSTTVSSAEAESDAFSAAVTTTITEATQPASAAAATSASTTEKTAETTTTETSASSTTASVLTTATTDITATATTEPLPAPVFTASFDEGFPTGDTVMHLKLLNNSGFRAISFAAVLPRILIADADEEDSPDYTASDAFKGENFFCYYGSGEEANRFAVGYSDTASGAPTELLCDVPLHISEEADFNKEYPVRLILSSLVMADGRSYTGIETDAVFIPAESPLRELSADSLLFREIGLQEQLSLSPEPPAGSCRWESSNPEAVSVDENGLVTALQEGSALITVTCQKRVYSCAVTVRFDRRMTPDSYTAEKQGEQFQFALECAPEIGLPPEGLEWISSDPEILSIDETGLATVHQNGSVSVTVVCGPVSYVNSFTVSIPRTLNETAYTFTECGETCALSLSPAPDSMPQFSSNHPEIASVDAEGIITPVQSGEAVISVISEGITYTCRVTVNFRYTLNIRDFAAREAGDTVKLRLLPKGSETPVPVWQSSDSSVAAVDEKGIVTLLAEGEAIITGTAEGYTYQCHVSLLPFLLGDVDYDGEVTAKDAQLALKQYVDILAQKPGTLTAHQILAADINRSSSVDVSDALRILKYATNRLACVDVGWDELTLQ